MSIGALPRVPDAATTDRARALSSVRLTPRTQTLVAAAVFAGVLAWRFATMGRLWMTTDLERHMAYADLVRAHGLRALRHSLTWWHIDAGGTWKGNVYNYPPVPLGMFWGLRTLGIGMVGARVLLTLVDAVAAALIGWRMRSRTIAIVMLALPQSQRWVTGEGQYEPVQSAFTVAALLSFARYPAVSGLLLALAVQSKMTAVAVLPVMAIWGYQRGRRHLVRFGSGVAVGLLPAVVVNLYYPMARNVLTGSSLINSNPWRVQIGGGPILPSLHTVGDLSLYVSLFAVTAIALVLVIKLPGRVARAEVLPILGFCVFVMFNRNGMPWYMLLLPSFAVVPSKRNTQFVLLAVSIAAGLVTVNMVPG